MGKVSGKLEEVCLPSGRNIPDSVSVPPRSLELTPEDGRGLRLLPGQGLGLGIEAYSQSGEDTSGGSQGMGT